MALTYPRRLAPGVQRVIGDDPLVEIAHDGTVAVLRSERGGRDIAVLHVRPPDTDPLLAEADRLAWLDGRCHAAEIIASGRSDEGDESVVIRLPAEAATPSSGMVPLQPDVVVERLGTTLRMLHRHPAADVPFDASPDRFRDRAESRVVAGLVATTAVGPYSGRDPVALLGILDDLLDSLGGSPEPMVLVHARPTVDHLWIDPAGTVVLTGWGGAGLGDRHHDLAVAAASVGELYGPSVVPHLLDAYGLLDIDLRRLDAHQLLVHLLG